MARPRRVRVGRADRELRLPPDSRFDHQRPAPDGSPRHDRERGVLYAGRSFTCVVGEFFGDQGEIALAGVRLARLTVTERLRLLDLRATAATGAGTIAAIAAVTQRATTQAWARWWYEHPRLADDLELAAHRLRLVVAR